MRKSNIFDKREKRKIKKIKNKERKRKEGRNKETKTKVFLNLRFSRVYRVLVTIFACLNMYYTETER